MLRPILLLFLFVVVLAPLLVPADVMAKGRVVPPVEWTWLPAWSHNGKLIAVQWPAPDRQLPDGTIQKIVTDQKLDSSARGIVHHVPSTLKATSDGDVGLLINFEKRKTLILDSASFECAPISLNYTIHDLAWSPNDKYLAGKANPSFGKAGLDSFGAVFDSKTGSMVLKIPDNAPGFMQGFVWAPDSKRIAICHTTGAHIWDVALRRQVYSIPDLKGYGYASIAWSPDGSSIAAYGSSEKNGFSMTSLRVCDANSGFVRFRIDKSNGAITGAFWSGDGKWFVYGDEDIHFLDPHTMKEAYKIDGNKVSEIVASPDGERLVYKDGDSIMHLFDVQRMRETGQITAEKTGLYQIRWSPNGSYIMINDRLDRIAICDARDGRYLGYKQFDDALPEWCPDSKSIVMLVSRTESVQIVPLNFELNAIAFGGGRPGNPWQDERVLRNLDDCFDELNRMLPSKAVEEIKNTQEDHLYLYTGGPSLGMQLRNMWGLRGSTPLVAFFNRLGITDGASMSTIIIVSYWRHLNSKPIEFEKQIEGYKFEADCQEPIVNENKQLPEDLLKFEAKGKDGQALSIASMPNGTKVVSFFLTSYMQSDTLLHCLRKARKKYPVNDVSMLVFAFEPEPPANSPHKPITRIDSHASIAKSLNERDPPIPWAQGTPELLKALLNFARGRVTRMNVGLPQTLIINKNGLVSTRFNDWYFGEDSEELEKAVDQALKIH